MHMHNDSDKNSIADVRLRETIIDIVATSTNKITPVALENRLVDEYSLGKRQIKTVIRALVAEGEIAYTYEYGCTFLERSFNRPVRVSKHIVLKPPGLHHEARPDDIVVQLNPGVSFGAGNHPTTRLALRGIEHLLLGERSIDDLSDGRVLDVGTGSGVLLIAAVLCGLNGGLGLDTDPCAVVEAAENVKINALVDRIDISDRSLSEIDGRFSTILANLRLPTLKNIQPLIDDRTPTTGYLVLSGIRDHELSDLLKVYEKIKFKKIWSYEELGWSAAVLRRKRFNS